MANRGTITGRAVIEKRPVHILDVASDPEYTLRESTSMAEQHTALGVPLLRENEPIGAIVLARKRVEPFTQKQIDLVTTFADQAVIAIENVRLFEQLRQRTDDLSESLQQQTATADVLKVISRSAFDLQSVLDTLVKSASTLCNADQGMLLLLADGVLMPHSYFGPYPDEFEFRKSLAAAPHRRQSQRAGSARRPNRPCRRRADRSGIHQQRLAGAHRLPRYARRAVDAARKANRRDGAVADTTGLFADRQIELVTTFADQAVIAIENVRLFDEVQAKTRDLSEALTYQTGSGNILRVIASSPTDVKPVLKAIVESACELCEADDALAR